MTAMILDLFAGCGGWDVGARLLGLDPIGVEWDADACATRAAAGLRTVRADLASYPPPRGGIDVLVASPPCQDYSQAGKRAGRTGARGQLTDVVPVWVEATMPRVVLCEQVPPVLPIWREHANAYVRLGYSVWTGILNAADYGVPQTRKRAILLARRDMGALPPDRTHGRVPRGVKRWVSMADALQWPGGFAGGAGSWTVNTGRDWQSGGTRADAQRVPLDQPAPTIDGKGRWRLCATNERPNSALRTPDEPAPTLAFGHETPRWILDRPETTIAGDARLWPPGDKINQDDIDRLGPEEAARRYVDRAGTEAIRLTIEDALVLQSFPRNYPVQGSKSAQFLQVGNAVPPRLARALIEEVTR